tara:strand:+ start:1489 stop:2082 length:594 start_codon:yes stop_codon:yes gene_type:complete
LGEPGFGNFAKILKMKGSQSSLYQELQDLITKHQKELAHLQALSNTELKQQPAPDKWSALECMEHLCRYGDFYLPEVKRAGQSAPKSKADRFKSSWLGEYFAASMWPKEGFKTMNTFKNMNPSLSDTRMEVLEQFETQLKAWAILVADLKDRDWQNTKTGISISSMIKLRLGDTLRVVFYHNERHMRQAFRAAGLES